MPSPTPVNRRTLLTMLGASIAVPLLAPRFAFSQEAWPARTVRYVNGFPAGGATDTLSRIIGASRDPKIGPMRELNLDTTMMSSHCIHACWQGKR